MSTKQKSVRRSFLVGAGVAAGAAAAQVTASGKVKAPGGYRIGNMYFSSGLTGVRPEARKDPLAFGGDIKEQTQKILEQHMSLARFIKRLGCDHLKINTGPRRPAGTNSRGRGLC